MSLMAVCGLLEIPDDSVPLASTADVRSADAQFVHPQDDRDINPVFNDGFAPADSPLESAYASQSDDYWKRIPEDTRPGCCRYSCYRVDFRNRPRPAQHRIPNRENVAKSPGPPSGTCEKVWSKFVTVTVEPACAPVIIAKSLLIWISV